jgi:hypothetical protein
VLGMVKSADVPAPYCRAGWTRHIWRGVDTLPAPLAARALAALAPDLRHQVEESLAIRWLPFDVHMAVLGALRSTLGARAYQKLCADQVMASLHNPALFAKPARAALRLYGAGPFNLFRAVDPSLRYIFRDAGRFRMLEALGAHELKVAYQGFPPHFAGGDVWSLIWVGTLEAIAAYALEGSALQTSITLSRHDPERGYFEWHVRATARRG